MQLLYIVISKIKRIFFENLEAPIELFSPFELQALIGFPCSI